MAVVPGAAQAAECPVPVTTQVFAEFGDPNQYFLAPGGDFESLSWARSGGAGSSRHDPFGLAPGASGVDLE